MPKMKKLLRVATKEELKMLQKFPRSEHIVVYYDRPYRKYKLWGTDTQSWKMFMILVQATLPLLTYEEYVPRCFRIPFPKALRIRVR